MATSSTCAGSWVGWTGFVGNAWGMSSITISGQDIDPDAHRLLNCGLVGLEYPSTLRLVENGI